MTFYLQSFIVLLYGYFFCFSIPPTLCKSSYTFERRLIVAEIPTTRHIANKETLLPPSDTCTTSAIEKSAGNHTVLSLFHRHGPCSPINKNVRPPLELLDATTLQAYYNSDIGSGDFVVPVGVGTPAKQFYLPVNVGLDFSWIQCLPCRQCFNQTEPIFDPSKSTSYASVPCGSASCIKDDGITCTGAKCTYSIPYVSNTITSSGSVSQDIFTLNDLKQSFVFGCNDYSVGDFGPNSGFLSLGRGPSSILSQKPSLFNNYFSYCIPSSSSSTGFLSLGNDGNSDNFFFVPFSQSLSGYSFDITGFAIGGVDISISPPLPILVTMGTYTRLPRSVYTSLKEKYMNAMAGVPRAGPAGVLDTCYDVTNVDVTSLASISFEINGGLSLSLSVNNLYVLSLQQACFAYLPTDNNYGTFGTTQQKTINFAFDLAGQRLGVGGNC